MLEFISCINVARHIFLLKIISPTSLIASDKLDVKLIIVCTIKREKFIQIAHKNSLKINWVGLCTSEKVIYESKSWKI